MSLGFNVDPTINFFCRHPSVNERLLLGSFTRKMDTETGTNGDYEVAVDEENVITTRVVPTRVVRPTPNQ
jgi:hypothetical protein